MVEDKKKGKHHEQEAVKHGKGRKDELSDKDLDKASGGFNPVDGKTGG